MKFLVALLLACVIYLSAFSEMVKPMRVSEKTSCCKKITGTVACAHHSERSKNNCDEPGCPMMLSCGICGFVVPGQLTLIPRYTTYLKQSLPRYIIGYFSTHLDADWKPPKAC